MLIIVDYGTGNIQNVQNALNYLGIENQLSDDPTAIQAADGLILPGVGAFRPAMAELKARRLVAPIQTAAAAGTPILGICMGMQLLFDRSLEFGETQGLGLIPGQVVPIPTAGGVKVPEVGWNQNRLRGADAVSDGFDGQYTYFVHSYYAETDPENIVATVNDGIDLPSIVRRGNVIGFQFHPEKSGAVGLAGLKQFKELVTNGNYSSN